VDSTAESEFRERGGGREGEFTERGGGREGGREGGRVLFRPQPPPTEKKRGREGGREGERETSLSRPTALSSTHTRTEATLEEKV
jgi:hypothetical protein